MNEFEIQVILVPELGRFYARVLEEKHNDEFNRIIMVLNDPARKFVQVKPNALAVGMLVVSYHFSEEKVSGFYRAKILKIEDSRRVEVRAFYFENKKVNIFV
jgi:hypothetical protein